MCGTYHRVVSHFTAKKKMIDKNCDEHVRLENDVCLSGFNITSDTQPPTLNDVSVQAEFTHKERIKSRNKARMEQTNCIISMLSLFPVLG